MHYQTRVHYVFPTVVPELRQVDTLRPLHWLARGWEDLVRTSGIGLGYGLLVTLLMQLPLLLTLSLGADYLAVVLMAGFALVGPLLAVGLYEVARRRELGLTLSLFHAWHGWRHSPVGILGMGLVLVLALLVWMMLAVLLAAVTSQYSTDPNGLLDATSAAGLLNAVRWPLVLAFGVSGALVAAVVFVLSAVSIPLVFEQRDIDIVSAMAISTRCVLRNRGAMALWATLVGLISAVAAGPLFLGLIVAFPLLAYATWHAYRDLVGDGVPSR